MFGGALWYLARNDVQHTCSTEELLPTVSGGGGEREDPQVGKIRIPADMRLPKISQQCLVQAGLVYIVENDRLQ